ncbi:MAG: hypothetical protein HY271_01975 [Deltaproteobacteria bacterium]|nr:hypothetical protein [Deltaproteobacteria bacterium]
MRRTPRGAFARELVRRDTVGRACVVASIVAPILLVVNHADLVLTAPLSWGVARRLAANFVVPYLVSSVSSALAARGERQGQR